MDVNRANGYQAPSPPPPMPGSGEFAPAPPQAPAVEVAAPAPAVAEVRTERAERASESTDSLQRAVREINSSIAIHRRHLSIRHHEATNRRIVTVYDSDSNEPIREIPPERVLEAHASMLEMVGLFMDTRG
ncbi:MAG: flagellar protein FlaG [Defluviitaleaceae bacterium]|nr:flagellar protein FlaG [Defluviitaleaceae bacterium]